MRNPMCISTIEFRQQLDIVALLTRVQIYMERREGQSGYFELEAIFAAFRQEAREKASV